MEREFDFPLKVINSLDKTIDRLNVNIRDINIWANANKMQKTIIVKQAKNLIENALDQIYKAIDLMD